MMKRTVLALAAGIALATPAAGQQALLCYPDTFLDSLKESHGEEVVTHALVEGGRSNYVMRLLVSEETGTWTIVVEHESGLLCPYMSGTDWDMEPPTLPDGEE